MACLDNLWGPRAFWLNFPFLLCLCIALAKEEGDGGEMAEMIVFEIDSLEKELKEIEEKLKVNTA